MPGPVKKYLLLAIVACCGLGALSFLYVRSKSQVLGGHQEALDVFAGIRETNWALENEILKLRDFAWTDYDSLTEKSKALAVYCSAIHDSPAFSRLGPATDERADKLCASIQDKIRNIDTFKFKNAALKNSIHFLHRVSTKKITGPQLKNTHGHDDVFERAVIRTALAYFLISTDETKDALVADIRVAKEHIQRHRSQEHQGLVDVLEHADRVFLEKESLDDLVDRLTGEDKIYSDLEALRLHYMKAYFAGETSALTYRNLLFVTCMILFLLILYGVVSLWRAAGALADANDNLEKRVDERTQELIRSQELVLGQQQALVAAAKMSALGEMAGGVAHEINTPLSVIAMRAEQLHESVEEGVGKKEILDTLKLIRATASRIAKIVHGMRVFARDGKLSEMQKVEVRKILDDTLALCGERFRNNGVVLELEDSHAMRVAVVVCRPVEISQVLLNLLNNAFDAVESLPKKWVKIGAIENNGFVEISVTDSGRGIPKELREKLMQPFFTTKEVGRGTGLGLSISRGILDTHKGALLLDENSHHTRFIVRLRALPQVKSA